MDDIDFQTNIIKTGIQLKFISAKKSYGTNQLFQVLGEKQLEDVLLNQPKKILKCLFGNTMVMLSENNDKKVTEYAVDFSKADGNIEVVNFTKGMPYILDATFYKYEFEK